MILDILKREQEGKSSTLSSKSQ